MSELFSANNDKVVVMAKQGLLDWLHCLLNYKTTMELSRKWNIGMAAAVVQIFQRLIARTFLSLPLFTLNLISCCSSVSSISIRVKRDSCPATFVLVPLVHA
ncbi:hypothetical protein Cni_G24122 [Canna indica]|uniref:Uncharacterized protein n=1 Tax=Canna indica TaxID=4628 RepID=A0AAQ3KZN5_9LILI|nr:hypothetical protein Cni_G24122 [Canna indica]